YQPVAGRGLHCDVVPCTRDAWKEANLDASGVLRDALDEGILLYGEAVTRDESRRAAQGSLTEVLTPPYRSGSGWPTNSLLRPVSTKSTLAKSAQKNDKPPERSPTNVSFVTLGDATKVLPSRKTLRPTALA